MLDGDLTPLLILLLAGNQASSSDLVETLLTASDQLPASSRTVLGVTFSQKRAQDKDRDEAQLADQLATALTAEPDGKITEDQLAQLPVLKRVVDRLPQITRDRVVKKAAPPLPPPGDPTNRVDGLPIGKEPGATTGFATADTTKS